MKKYYVLKDASLLSQKDLLAYVNAVALIEVLRCNYCCTFVSRFWYICVHISTYHG